MIGYGKQSINNKEINQIKKVLKSDFLTQGPKIEEFENALRNKFGSKYCTAVSSGTAALHLAGLSLGWEKNDYIITTPLTFLATVNSIVYCHSTPIFVDIDPSTYCIDVNKLEKKIQELRKQNKKIKAIIAVDFAGHPCDWESIHYLFPFYQF